VSALLSAISAIRQVQLENHYSRSRARGTYFGHHQLPKGVFFRARLQHTLSLPLQYEGPRRALGHVEVGLRAASLLTRSPRVHLHRSRTHHQFTGRIETSAPGISLAVFKARGEGFLVFLSAVELLTLIALRKEFFSTTIIRTLWATVHTQEHPPLSIRPILDADSELPEMPQNTHKKRQLEETAMAPVQSFVGGVTAHDQNHDQTSTQPFPSYMFMPQGTM
jgi:hypothetical protein